MPPQPIKRLLVANRGEIATRIISSARELGIETFATFTDNDIGHTYNAAHAIRLSSPAAYLDVQDLVRLAERYHIDAVHPGYGFLSESAQMASAMAERQIVFIGPGAEILEKTGDKLQARFLAEACSVPVLPALTTSTNSLKEVQSFASQNGFPIMVKAVDGGGGRGIRLVQRVEDLERLVTRALEESPSRQVFAEKAAVNGFRHIEVQIIGDSRGNIMHLFERECSIQRRYQKIVELAPSTVADRTIVAPVIDAALRMAKKIHYRSLGTFEFLLNPSTSEFYFLEINPRLQVEHTVTESICGIDIVKAQLQIAEGATLAEVGLGSLVIDPLKLPQQHSMQLRITAEDPEKDWSLSIGRIQSFRFPSGNGVRVDTALLQGAPAVVSADFDSVVAKLIVTAPSWEGVLRKAARALEDVSIVGVRTNVEMLRALIAHPDFRSGSCDTRWLEAKHHELLEQSNSMRGKQKDSLHGLVAPQSTSFTSAALSATSSMFRRDDAWSVVLKPRPTGASNTAMQHHLQLSKVLRNDFPSSFAAEISFAASGSKPQEYTMDMRSTSASASALNSQHRQGSRSDPTHVIVPFSGKLVEVLVDAGDAVKKDDVICVIKQMKMELEVRSHKAGIVTWVTEAEDHEDVAEGLLAAVVEDERMGAKL